MAVQIPCPRCNSMQPFGTREMTNALGQLELYVQCQKCRWRKVMDIGQPDKVRIKRDLDRLRQKIEAQGGNASLERVWRKRFKRLMSM